MCNAIRRSYVGFIPSSFATLRETVTFASIIILGIHFCGCRPAPIKVGACRALAQLFEQIDVSSLRPHLGPVFTALAKLLQEVGLISLTVISKI